jgi:hypothetical protein
MNKDKMIEFAKEHCEIFPENSYMGEYLRETLKMLQEEPCEDAISKASVFEILGNLMSIPYDFDRQITEKDVSESMDEIGALPHVTPTRKKGKWIKIGDKGFGWSDTVICKCSECEYKTEFRGKFDGQYLIVDQEHAHKYCPSCGTEMESKE